MTQLHRDRTMIERLTLNYKFKMALHGSNLPPPALAHILSYFKEHECRKLRMVSKAWDSCFRKDIGLRLKVTNSNWAILKYQMGLNSSFSGLTFSDMTIPLGSFITFSEHVNLTSLSFHRITVPYNIIWSLNLFKNLKSLTFCSIFLEKLPSVDTLSQFRKLTLPKLQKIMILSKTRADVEDSDNFVLTTDKTTQIPEDESLIINFLSKISYKCLSGVHLFCSEEVLLAQPFQQLFDAYSSLTDMQGLTTLLYRNRVTLKEFIAGPSQTHIVLAWKLQPGETIWKRQMQLVCCDSYLDVPAEWNVMFQSQSHLQFIRLNGAYRHWTSFQAGLKNCEKTIQEVHLAGGGFGSTADLSGFKNCVNLSCLEILMDDCHLENIHRLPVSLRKLRMNGPLTSEDLLSIANQLENLEEFYLHCNLPSEKYTFHGNKIVIPGTITENLMEVYLTLPKINSLTFRKCRMEVMFLTSFLGNIEGIQVKMYQIQGYPWNTHGSISIQIPARKYRNKQNHVYQ